MISPGHEQYTRNMATAASTCQLAVMLIDARHGVLDQTLRHTYICSLLGIKHFIVVINKMDLVGFNQEIYKQIKSDFKQLTNDLKLNDLRFVPISALKGDNVASNSSQMNWYPGSTLLRLLETVTPDVISANHPFRFPVQYVNRLDSRFRGYCGAIASGSVTQGDVITVLPSNVQAEVVSILINGEEVKYASTGQAITLILDSDIDISRGDLITFADESPQLTNNFYATVIWMSEQASSLNRDYLLKLNTKSSFGRITKIEHVIDIKTLLPSKESKTELSLNDISVCHFSVHEDIAFDVYSALPKTGSFYPH